jgi:AcrR family transcriptional regulator
MDAIAARAGVPRSTLYKRYPDKKELLRAVLRDRLSTWTVADSDDELGHDLETRLKHYAAAMVGRAMSPELRALLGLVANAWNGPDEANSRRDVIGYTGMLDRLEREIRDYGPGQGIHAKNPRRAAMALMAMLTGWIQWNAPAEGEAEAAAIQFAHDAARFLIAGSAAW